MSLLLATITPCEADAGRDGVPNRELPDRSSRPARRSATVEAPPVEPAPAAPVAPEPVETTPREAPAPQMTPEEEVAMFAKDLEKHEVAYEDEDLVEEARPRDHLRDSGARGRIAVGGRLEVGHVGLIDAGGGGVMVQMGVQLQNDLGLYVDLSTVGQASQNLSRASLLAEGQLWHHLTLAGGVGLGVDTATCLGFEWTSLNTVCDYRIRGGGQGLVVTLPVRVAINFDALHSRAQRHRFFIAFDGTLGTIVNPPPTPERPLSGSPSGFELPLSFTAGLSVGYVIM